MAVMGNAVSGKAVIDLAKQVALAQGPARARRAGFRVDNDPVRRNGPCAQKRDERQKRGRDITAGVCGDAGLFDLLTVNFGKTKGDFGLDFHRRVIEPVPFLVGCCVTQPEIG
jgi:hypothetical protein